MGFEPQILYPKADVLPLLHQCLFIQIEKLWNFIILFPYWKHLPFFRKEESSSSRVKNLPVRKLDKPITKPDGFEKGKMEFDNFWEALAQNHVMKNGEG